MCTFLLQECQTSHILQQCSYSITDYPLDPPCVQVSSVRTAQKAVMELCVYVHAVQYLMCL